MFVTPQAFSTRSRTDQLKPSSRAGRDWRHRWPEPDDRYVIWTHQVEPDGVVEDLPCGNDDCMTEPTFDSMHAWLRYTNARYELLARQMRQDVDPSAPVTPAQRLPRASARNEIRLARTLPHEDLFLWNRQDV